MYIFWFSTSLTNFQFCLHTPVSLDSSQVAPATVDTSRDTPASQNSSRTGPTQNNHKLASSPQSIKAKLLTASLTWKRTTYRNKRSYESVPPNNYTSEVKPPHEYFLKYFTLDLLNDAATFTNQYFLQSRYWQSDVSPTDSIGDYEILWHQYYHGSF